jgi:hypothetical protein
VFFSGSIGDFFMVCVASNLIEIVFLFVYLKRDHARELMWNLASMSLRVTKAEEVDAAMTAQANVRRAQAHNYLLALRLTYQALGARISMALVSILALSLSMDLLDVATRFVICVTIDMVTDVVKREFCFRYSVPVHLVRDAMSVAAAFINASLSATNAAITWVYVISLRCYVST